jgi:hypothetical protein
MLLGLLRRTGSVGSPFVSNNSRYLQHKLSSKYIEDLFLLGVKLLEREADHSLTVAMCDYSPDSLNSSWHDE